MAILSPTSPSLLRPRYHPNPLSCLGRAADIIQAGALLSPRMEVVRSGGALERGLVSSDAPPQGRTSSTRSRVQCVRPFGRRMSSGKVGPRIHPRAILLSPRQCPLFSPARGPNSGSPRAHRNQGWLWARPGPPRQQTGGQADRNEAKRLQRLPRVVVCVSPLCSPLGNLDVQQTADAGPGLASVHQTQALRLACPMW